MNIEQIINDLQEGYVLIYNFLNKQPNKRYFIGGNCDDEPHYLIKNIAEFDEDGYDYSTHILALRISKNSDAVEAFVDKTGEGDVLDDNEDFWGEDYQDDYFIKSNWVSIYNKYEILLNILLWANKNKKLGFGDNGIKVDSSEKKLKNYDIIL